MKKRGQKNFFRHKLSSRRRDLPWGSRPDSGVRPSVRGLDPSCSLSLSLFLPSSHPNLVSSFLWLWFSLRYFVVSLLASIVRPWDFDFSKGGGGNKITPTTTTTSRKWEIVPFRAIHIHIHIDKARTQSEHADRRAKIWDNNNTVDEGEEVHVQTNGMRWRWRVILGNGNAREPLKDT